MLSGQIRPVIKNKSLGKTESANYRPVMNSSNFLKLFDCCINPFLQNHLVLNNRQFGFRKNTGCPDVLAILKETILKYIAGKSRVYCAMIDISKAFDKIDYDILISKILKTSLPKQIVYMLEFMFKNTYVNTSINKVASEPWRVENGTRQGGINSPILFSFYINDTINAISNMNVGCSLGGIRTNIICYADDVCLLAPTAVALQKLIDVASVQLENIRLDVNVSKCACMVFSKRNSYKATPRIMLNNQIIDRVSEFKYLGVIISEDLNINSDINRVSTAFLKQFYSMYSKFYNLNNNVLHHLFRTYTSSFYGIEKWYDSLSIIGILINLVYVTTKLLKRLRT